MTTLDSKIPRPSAEQCEPAGGEIVNTYLASLCELTNGPSLRAAVIEALFSHPAVQRKLRQHVNRQLARRRKHQRTWEADEMHSIAREVFMEVVEEFDASRNNASFLGMLDYALRSIGFQFEAQRSQLSANALAGRARRARANASGSITETENIGQWCFVGDDYFDAGIGQDSNKFGIFGDEYFVLQARDAHFDVIRMALELVESAHLDERERVVTVARLELASSEGVPPSDRALAEHLGMSSSTVQRINVSARRKLRRARLFPEDLY